MAITIQIITQGWENKDEFVSVGHEELIQNKHFSQEMCFEVYLGNNEFSKCCLE